MSVAFGYLLAVVTFLVISGTKSSTASSPSRSLLLESQSTLQEEEGSEEESLDEVNTVLYYRQCGFPLFNENLLTLLLLLLSSTIAFLLRYARQR
jgi:hypothetical protein